MKSGQRRITVEAVAKTYETPAPPTPVLESVDLTVGHQEFVAVLGPSGCGKSTLLDLIAGLEEPTRGQIVVDGRTDRLGRLGLMPQRDLLMPWKRVVDNVALGAVVRGVPRGSARERARSLLDRFDLGEFADRYPAELSGGMRQRVALARTFLSGADLLLLDEPLAALDSLTRQRMQTWLADTWQGTDSSVLLVTHDIDEAIRLADRVYVLTPRPATVADVIDIPLPRPRPYELVLSPKFLELKSRAMHHLHQDPGEPQ